MSGSQMQLYAREQLAYPAADLDHKQPQGVELHPLDSRGHQLAPQHVQEPIGRCVQQQPELVGKKTLAAEPIGFEMPLEVLDVVLDLAALYVELIELFRPGGLVGYHKASVGAFGHGLRLVDHPSGALPTAGLV